MGQVARKLGRRVATLRREAGLTQAALAEMVDVTTETISRLERGAVIPSLERMEQVGAALNVELFELFRFRSRETDRDKAIGHLVALLRRRDVTDIEALTEIAGKILSKWGPG
jgi:transcriptional regulator with XRE-family HTH domain